MAFTAASSAAGRELQARRSDLAQELDERGVDLVRSLLLQPVTGAREHFDAPQAGNSARERRQRLGCVAGDQVQLATEVERRLVDRGADERSEDPRQGVDVAVVVQAAPEAATAELTDVEREIVGRQP